MPKITYVAPDGSEHAVDAPEGTSVMQAAVDHGVPGILADCGGSAACATCHVYVAKTRTGLLPPLGDVEDEMLDFTAAPRRANSRLSCQLPVTGELDDLVVHLPENQV